MRTRLENLPPERVRANTAGTPAKRWVAGKARESSVTWSPAAQPPAAEPNTRVVWPAGTVEGETWRAAARAIAASPSPCASLPDSPGALQAGHSLHGRRRRPGGQGHAVHRYPGRRRPGRVGRPLR